PRQGIPVRDRGRWVRVSKRLHRGKGSSRLRLRIAGRARMLAETWCGLESVETCSAAGMIRKEIWIKRKTRDARFAAPSPSANRKILQTRELREFESRVDL